MDCPGRAVLEHNALAGLELGELAGTVCSDRCLEAADEVLLGLPRARPLDDPRQSPSSDPIEGLGGREVVGRPILGMRDEPAEPLVVEVVGHSGMVAYDTGGCARDSSRFSE